jgi:hypothetical protein
MMKPKDIKTKETYKQALPRVEALWSAPKDSVNANELE